MLDKNYDYIVLSNGTEFTILDRKRKGVISLKHGTFIDITKDCKKLYNKDIKANKTSNLYIGGQWYGYSQGLYNYNSLTVYSDNIELITDDRKELDKRLLKLKLYQINAMLKQCNSIQQKMYNKKQYYLYTFNNCDFM